MSNRIVLITAPSLDTRFNVSGISSVTNFIIHQNSKYTYRHFEIGRKDSEKRGLKWLGKVIITTLKWISIVSSRNVSIVHFNLAFSKPSIIRDVPLILYAKLIRKRIVLHVHGGEFLLKTEAPSWMRILLRSVFTRNIPVLVLSMLEREALLHNFSINNIIILPNCVDLSVARKVNRNYASQDKLNLLFLGRIHADKGLELIYQAMIILIGKNISFSFFMAGTGPQEKLYTTKFSTLLGDKFTFCGVVSGSTKNSLLSNCDIFLLPSLYEGLPMALLESMSFGLVPVVTNIGSIGTVVKNAENGILLGINPSEEIALAIEKLGKDRLLLQLLSKEARNSIFNNFSPEKYIFCLNEIYDIA